MTTNPDNTPVKNALDQPAKSPFDTLHFHTLHILLLLPISWIYLIALVGVSLILRGTFGDGFFWGLTAIAGLPGIMAASSEKRLTVACKGCRLLILVTLLVLTCWSLVVISLHPQGNYLEPIVDYAFYIYGSGMALLLSTIVAMALARLSRGLVWLFDKLFTFKPPTERSFYFSLIIFTVSLLFVVLVFNREVIPPQEFMLVVALTLNGMGLMLALRDKVWGALWHDISYILLHWCVLAIPLLLYVPDSAVQNGFFVIVLLVQASLWFVWLTAKWQRPLREVPLMADDQPNTVPGIAAEVENYIDQRGHVDAISGFIYAAPKSAVVGITGIRGAGKSALLGAVSARLNKDFKVLQMTAPTRKDEGMAFFMTVCRNLCREVIRDTAHRVQGEQAPENQANRESKSRIRWLIFAVVATLVASVYAVYLFNVKGFSANSSQRQFT